MFPLVDTKVPSAVQQQVSSRYKKMFPTGDVGFVARAFDWAGVCFAGEYDGYQKIDALYHDFEHTMQGTLCLVELIHARFAAKVTPTVPERFFQLMLLAVLFHDSGYLKKKGDTEGTGAKYTPVHVARGAEFAKDFLAPKGFNESELDTVHNLISCTGVNADLETIPFGSDLERTLGFALATADLLGQMAAHDYIDKLPGLFLEFQEASRYNFGKPMKYVFPSAEELMRNTPLFWQNYVIPRINNDFARVYTFLNDPYPGGPNAYIVHIEQNIERLRKRLGLSH